jgi:Zinc knuckle
MKGILDHVIADRYLASQDKDLKIYLKEKGKLKLKDLAQYAQSHLDACETDGRSYDQSHMKSDGAKHNKLDSKYRPEANTQTVDSSKLKHDYESIEKTKNGGFSKSRSTITCYTCGKVGHKSVDCDISKSHTQKDKMAKKSAACQAVEFNDSDSVNNNS